MPRKKIDKLVDFAKDYGAKGLAYVKVEEGRFEFDVSWEFMNYNLIFAETSTIEVIVEE